MEDATYYFRGYLVFKFNHEWKQLDIGEKAYMCNFIPEDYKLMQQFLNECTQFIEGKITQVDSIEVN